MLIKALRESGAIKCAKDFRNFEPLVEAFENGEKWVIENPEARRLLCDLMRGRAKKRGKVKTQAQEEFELSCAGTAGMIKGYLGDSISLYETSESSGRPTACHIVGDLENRSTSTIVAYVKKQDRLIGEYFRETGKQIRERYRMISILVDPNEVQQDKNPDWIRACQEYERDWCD